MKIPFTIPYTTPRSAENVRFLLENQEEIKALHFTGKCESWFENNYPGYSAYLTTTCTHALEVALRAFGLEPGDEVIVPAYNYVGVANAVLNADAIPVFVDIEPVTMNVSVDAVREAVTSRTRVINMMHYGGVSCDIEGIRRLCDEFGLFLLEDNAHGINATGPDGLLGSTGDMSCISFDRLKNISVHQGGVLLCRERFIDAVDTAYDNGTNRQRFFRGEIGSYSWIDRGSNYPMSELLAAALYPLLEASRDICRKRRSIWDMYFERISADPALAEMLPRDLEKTGHNGHIFYLKAKGRTSRDMCIGFLQEHGVESHFHYTPLHTSQAGMKFGRFNGDDVHTTRESDRLFRLPVHNYLTMDQIDYAVATLRSMAKQTA